MTVTGKFNIMKLGSNYFLRLSLLLLIYEKFKN